MRYSLLFPLGYASILYIMADKEDKALPGLLRDPWRVGASAPKVEPEVPEHVRTISTDDSPILDDIQEECHSTIELKGYGGITVDGVTKLNHAASQVLKFCVDHHKEIDDIFLQYGVLLTPFDVTDLQLSFFIQRDDGWLLAVPEATTRDAGCLQLIQAMLEVYTLPKLRKKMQKYRIRPYKM